MNFDLNDDQSMLQDSLKKLLSDQYDFEQRRAHKAGEAGYSAAMWSQFAELGLLALPFAEEDGNTRHVSRWVRDLIIGLFIEYFGSAESNEKLGENGTHTSFRLR